MTKIIDFYERIFYKLRRIAYYFFHPFLWSKGIEINGVPNIQHPQYITIGNNLSINENVFLQGRGGITIGDNVTLSYGSIVLTESLDAKNYKTTFKDRKHIYRPVIIGDDVWVCANVTITPGTRISKGIIISAGSVVKGELDREFSIYSGNPATFVKKL